MSESTPCAVFISYAREDTAAAQRLAEALRSHGVEVWFDENELRGGDQWDAKIRKQIDACTLFVPVISRHTQERSKGYFRLEWKLAVEQTHLMAEGMAFLAPVVVDDTTESGAVVPPEFMRVQWTRLPGALPTPQFVGQVKKLLVDRAGKASHAPQSVAAQQSAAIAKKPAIPGWMWGVLAAVLVVVGILTLRQTEPPAVTAAKPPVPALTPAALAADVKSIAVLPFANLSTERENEFFADGVHDDVITNLAKIRDLKVISRTSVLAYRDPAARNLKKIAAELGVATVLEGSIRRVGSKVHMNAQLIDARTDEHLWADTFDGDTGDIFALQADLAQKIAAALKATLTTSERTLIERRPTENQEAYELYSRARLLQEKLSPFSTREEFEPVVVLLEQAVARDPAFALAFANLSIVHGLMYWFGNVDATAERRQRAQAALEAAQRLAPEAPETHIAQGAFAYQCKNDWHGALAEYAVAERNLPNDAQLQYRIGIAHRRLVQWPEALSRFERSAALNPHDLSSVSTLVDTALSLRHYERTRAFATRYQAIFPNDWRLRSLAIRAQFALDADRAAYARAWGAPRPGDDERARLQAAYESAIFAGDLTAAERTLADPRLTTLTTSGGTTVEPAALHRALVAFALGQREAAVKFSNEALAFYRSRTWTPRQQPPILLDIAQAEACAGRAEDAIRNGRAAMVQYAALDPYSALNGELRLGRIYALLDHRDDAFAALRKVMGAAEAISPSEVRIDAGWSRLKDDPRFEEILKSAKPL
jgi:TolB-like protein/Tfp pilus assembly protein PilF